jgi:hypothetical protein
MKSFLVALSVLMNSIPSIAALENEPKLELKIAKYCIVAGHLREVIDGHPCGSVIDATGNVVLDPTIVGDCKPKSEGEPTVACNPLIFGRNNTCVRLPLLTKVTPTSTESCKSLLNRGDQNMIDRMKHELVTTTDAEQFRSEAFERTNEYLSLSNCGIYFAKDQGHLAQQKQDLMVRNMSRECYALRDVWTHLSAANCSMDRSGLALFRKLKASGQAWITKFNNNFRLSYIKKTQLTDYLPDAAGRPPKLVISQVPYCQATYMMQLKQLLALHEVAPEDDNEDSTKLALDSQASPTTEGSTDDSELTESQVAESPAPIPTPRAKPSMASPVKPAIAPIKAQTIGSAIIDDNQDADAAYSGGGFKCPRGTTIGPNRTCIPRN